MSTHSDKFEIQQEIREYIQLNQDIKSVFDALNDAMNTLHRAYDAVASKYTISGNSSSYQGSILSLAREISNTSNYLKNIVNRGIVREIKSLKEELRDMNEED